MGRTLVGGVGIPARYAGSGTGIVGMPGGRDTAGAWTSFKSEGTGNGGGGGAVPNKCAVVAAGPVTPPPASELAADVTSLGGGAYWSWVGLGAGGCRGEAVGGGGGIGPTIGDVTVAGIIGTTIVGEAPICTGLFSATNCLFCGGGFAIALVV